MKAWLFSFLIPGVAVWAASCTAEQASPPEAPCDAAETVTYRVQVARIFYNNCITCHNNASRLGSISLEGYENAKQVVREGRLLGAVRHAPGFSPMPQGNGPRLSECDIQAIEQWLNNGTPY
ncbi:hypothetical protein [Chitinophaga sp. YIM B06452]|uniref:hypothetical protein n=1 Tax=Chitinophaga sp. YIM B06452 TaxID=3082158 RepID=UPI0031FE9652